MSLDEGLYNHLTSHSGLAEFVGTRIYPDEYRQGLTLPAVAYSVDDEESDHTQQGPSGLRKTVYSIDAWAQSSKQAMAVARQLRDALDGFRGYFAAPSGLIRICGVLFDGAERGVDPETGTFGMRSRFVVWYHEK